MRDVFSPRLRIANLGQASPPQVVVVDILGMPFKDAVVSVSSGGKSLYDVSTNAEGAAELSNVSAPFQIRVSADGYTVTKNVDSLSETVFVQLPVHAHQAVLSPLEIGLFAGALVAGAAGYHWKIQPLRTVAEVLFGTGVFSAVFRNSSCG